MLEAVGAERAILSILMKDSNEFFNLDDVLEPDDFVNNGNRLIFSVIKDLVLSDKDIGIDQYVLISHAEQKGLDDFLRLTQNGDLIQALEATKNNVNPKSLRKHVVAVKMASVKRTLINTLENIKDDVEDFKGDPIELKSMAEEAVLKSIEILDTGQDDIVCLADDFEEIIQNYADIANVLGLDIGFPRWQKDCAALRNGTVTGLFARAKEGKSQFSAHAMKEIGIIGSEELGQLPVLYLDTEMQAADQQMRVCSMLTKIPYERMESGAWKSKKDEIELIREAFKLVKGSPIYYKNIAGKSVNHVLPVIRKFIHKQVGGRTKGTVPRCLVIYDYIKLMNPSDLKYAQEYQILGFLLSALHDLAIDLNFPMLVLGQLNREALRIDSVGSIAGSDRITHNVDSLTLFRKKREGEIDADGQRRGTHIMKTILARKGPGHDFDEWVNIHFDKGAGQFTEDKRNSEVVESLRAIRAVRDRLNEQDTAPFADIREDE